jgi:hypothetical protein
MEQNFGKGDAEKRKAPLQLTPLEKSALIFAGQLQQESEEPREFAAGEVFRLMREQEALPKTAYHETIRVMFKRFSTWGLVTSRMEQEEEARGVPRRLYSFTDEGNERWKKEKDQ